MDDYQVISAIGEGSFGRVFKARRKVDHKIVAIKLIPKFGRIQKELKTLRKECDIQRNLDHPNIIRMLDAFETETEMAVVTEFAYQDLNVVLAKNGILKEECAAPIICDLISALHYLHSHRVLHRDLKPQNVLLGGNNEAKLCDFGFARNMSNGTHVLTSIKGTPLYMAPELVEESPYDHNADLWSLGCIAYEILVGSPPFTTTSILHLVQMIRHEKIKWPTHVTLECQDLLKGLLTKDPTKRLTWPNLLHHPFVDGKVLITGNEGTGLTALPTDSQALSKETQKKEFSAKHKNQGNCYSIQKIMVNVGGKQDSKSGKEPINLAELRNHMQLYKYFPKLSKSLNSEPFYEGPEIEEELKGAMNYEESENATLFEADEWMAFLQRSMEEMMDGDDEFVHDHGFLNMVCRALSLRFPQVICYTASLLSIPFTLDGIGSEDSAKICKVYGEMKLIGKLVYASKLVISRMENDNKVSSESIDALEQLYLLISFLVHSDQILLKQFCVLSYALALPSHLRTVFKLRIHNDKLADHVVVIFCQLLRRAPEYVSIVQEVIQGFNNPEAEIRSTLSIDNEPLCTHTLVLITLLSHACPTTLMSFMSKKLVKDVGNLSKWPHGNIATEAKKAHKEIKILSKPKAFYDREN